MKKTLILRALLCCTALLVFFSGMGVALAQSTTFYFTLDEPCKTSAAVYKPDGTLVRTLWSKVRYYSPGTYSGVWDGLDDETNAVASGTYQITVLQHNTEYYWEGAIGNSSAAASGPTVHVGFWPIRSIAISGTNAFYDSGYDEGKYDFRKFLTTDAQHVNNSFYWIYSSQLNEPISVPGDVYDLNWLWATADTNIVYFGCSDSPNPSTIALHQYPGCIVAVHASDCSPYYFSAGGQIINGGGNTPILNGVYVGTQPGLSGMSAQQNGNLLAVAVNPDNTVYLLNKTTGAVQSSFSVPAPHRLNFSPDGTLWVVSSNNVVCYTNVASSPTAVVTIPNFSEPLDVAINPTNGNLVLVADGGTNQQIFAFGRNGSPLWTYGLHGGYQSNGAAVSTNKFWFFDGENDGTFLSYAPDGSFWVGDGGNDRCMHFSGGLQYIEQIMYQQHSYVASVDKNNPSRVTQRFLEYNVDYTKPLSNGWTYVNNWKANVPQVNMSSTDGIYETTTFSNGHTYALIDNEQYYPYVNSELCELVFTNDLRLTGLLPEWSDLKTWISFGADGSARRTPIGEADWYETTLNGFDESNNPIWNPEITICTATANATDPIPGTYGFGNIRVTMSSNNILASVDNSLNVGWHLGGVRVGGTNWLWRASPGVNTMNGCGTYEIGNGVQYGGDTLEAIDRNIMYGYHGEFFRNQGQAGQIMHFYDDGLFVGQFGEASPGHSAYEEPLPGFAGNGLAPNLCKTTNGDFYLWINDESDHGPQCWHWVNARNIREQSGSGTLGTTFALTNVAPAFPTGVVAKNGNQRGEISWRVVPGASSYNVYYSTMNGGPYSTLAGSTAGEDFVASGLTNGQTYYFAVTAVQGGVEGIPSEQAAVNPFDTTQSVLSAGTMTEGGQETPVIDVSSTAPLSGWPSYLWAEHLTGDLNLRELDYYGYGNLQNESVGTEGYVLCDWGGPASSVTNILGPFSVAFGSGWADVPYLERTFRLDGTLGSSNGWTANPIGTVSINVSDTNYHYLTVVSPSEFNYARSFTLSLNSTNGNSVSFPINESPGLSHVFQFLFKGDVTLVVDSTGGIEGNVQGLFFDNAAVTPSVAQFPSTTTIGSSPNPVAPGVPVTLTASVFGSGGIPTGAIAFYDGATNLGGGVFNGSNAVSLTTTNLAASRYPHSITAQYGGNGTFSGSISGVLSELVSSVVLVDVTNGLAARWPFSEGSGASTADASGHGNTGFLFNSPTWISGLPGDDALSFIGYLVPGASYMSAANSATLCDQGLGSNLTICAWVKRSAASLNEYCSVMSKDVTNDSAPYHRNYEMLFDNNNHLLFIFRNSAGSAWDIFSSSSTFTDTNNWHFYCISYTYGNASSCELYADGGQLTGSWTSGSGSDAPASTSGGPLLVGIDGTGTASNGSDYDYISIYNAILTATQIGSLYAFENTTSTVSRPQLTLSQSAGSFVLGWPSAYSDWVLQTATNLSHPVWQTVSVSNTNSIVIPITNQQQYFRLQNGD